MIYFIQNELTKNIKIGYSNDPEKRIKSLKTSIPENISILKVINGSRIEEKQIHKMFDKYRITGEWFYENKEILEFIKRDVYIQESGYTQESEYIRNNTFKVLICDGRMPAYLRFSIDNNCIIRSILWSFAAETYIECTYSNIYVLLKHSDGCKIKPYHIESLKRFYESPPGNKKYRLYGIYSNSDSAFLAMTNELNGKQY